MGSNQYSLELVFIYDKYLFIDFFISEFIASIDELFPAGKSVALYTVDNKTYLLSFT